MKEWNDSVGQSAIAQTVEADRLANMPGFMQHVKSQMKAANVK